MSDQFIQQILDELKEAKQERRSMKVELNNRFEALDANMSNMKFTVSKMDTKISSMEENMSKMDSKISNLEMNMSKVDTKISNLETNTSKNNAKISRIETKMSNMERDIKEIKSSVYRMEKNEPQDILAMLENINNKLEVKDSDIGALNKRLFKVESTLERLTGE